MLIECIPNVSEGRRPEIVAGLADAIRAVPGVRLLDFSSDPSHNRSVFTLVGDAEGVERATLALFERAIAAIDLRHLKGPVRIVSHLEAVCRIEQKRYGRIRRATVGMLLSEAHKLVRDPAERV